MLQTDSADISDLTTSQKLAVLSIIAAFKETKMNQYKVIVGSSFFQIGSIVKLVETDGDLGALFECIDSGLHQFVKMTDVELIEVSQQEAAIKLEAIVEDIYQKIAEAEALADSYGLSFSLDIANGMVGDYYGDDAGRVAYDRSYDEAGGEAGWNT